MEMENETSSIQSSDTDKISLLLVFCAVTILMVFLVYTENFVFGSEKGNWQYRYFKDVAQIPLWQPIIIVGLLYLSVFIGGKLIYKYETLTLFGCFLAVVIIQILIRNTYPVSMEAVVQSDRANGFYSVAMKYSPSEILSQYNNLISTFPMHVRANLPGKILLFEALKVFTLSPGIMAYLIIAFSTLGSIFIYGICLKLFLNKTAALYAFVLYAMIPGKLFFYPLLNTVTPVFMLLCIYLFVIYIDSKNSKLLWLLGLALFMLVVFEPSPLVVGLIFIGVAVKAIGEKKIILRDLIKIVVFPVSAFLVVYLLFLLFFSFDLIQAFRFILDDAASFNLNSQRGYRVWFGENLKEFFYSAGTPIVLIFIYTTSRLVLNWKSLFKQNIFDWVSEHFYSFSLLLTFSFVVFLGINRGEISRLWIYLAVLFQIPAALFITKIPKSQLAFFIVSSTVIIQTIVALQRVGFVRP